jgi:Zn-dependent M16 (insulinase) family peptidase
MTGISGLFFVRELERRVADDWPGVLAQLEAVRRHLVNRAALVANVTLDADGFGEFAPALDDFLAELPAAEYAPAAWAVAAAGPNEGLTIPAKVNYVAKGADVRALGAEASGASRAVTRFLYNAYLLEKIRVQGGAYGAGSSYHRATGLFAWSSYRDPNLLRTLDVYDATGAFLRGAPLDRLTVERSIIGAIGDIDGYQLPDAKGYTAMSRWLRGVTDEWRQRIREELLDATEADFRAFAAVADAARDHGAIAVVGSAEAIEAANRERPGLLTPVKVL